MKPIDLPPAVLAHLRQNYMYDPETGEIWRRAGSLTKQGYWAVEGRLGTRKAGFRWAIKAHRLAYILMTGVALSQDQFVDHINGDRSDNRWVNLRVCTAAENAQNKRAWGKVRSRGVTLARSGRFIASIGTWPKRTYLGEFDTEADAANAYDHAAIARYGPFARTNS